MEEEVEVENKYSTWKMLNLISERARLLRCELRRTLLKRKANQEMRKKNEIKGNKEMYNRFGVVRESERKGKGTWARTKPFSARHFFYFST